MGMKKVGVVGCGLMGSGITQVVAEAGYAVIVREVDRALLDKGLGMITKNLGRAVEKGKLTPEARDRAWGNITGTLDLKDLRECEIVVEAIVEDLGAKGALFGELDGLCPPGTIFATNTSSLTVTSIAAATRRAEKMVGMHFFNPVPAMKLVEVVRALRTSEETFDAAMEFCRSLGKEPIAARDNCGFIVNLLLVPYLLDAIRALEAGVGSVEDMDRGMVLGCGHPMGPFTLLDFVGLDTTHHIANILFDEYREKRYAPPPLLTRLVQAGFLGKKSGRGFYDYSGPKPVPAPLGL